MYLQKRIYCAYSPHSLIWDSQEKMIQREAGAGNSQSMDETWAG